MHPLGRVLGQMEVTERRVVSRGEEISRQGVLVPCQLLLLQRMVVVIALCRRLQQTSA